MQAATKILAVQLIRLRQQITKLQGSRAQLRGVATHTKVGQESKNIENLGYCNDCSDVIAQSWSS